MASRWQATPRPGHPDPYFRWFIYLILPFPWLLCAVMAWSDVGMAVAASALTMGMAWMAYLRTDSRWLTLEWLALSLAAFGKFPPIVVLWLLSAVAAGATGAWLTRQSVAGPARQASGLGLPKAARPRTREDDFFFLPLVMAAFVFLALLALGLAGPWTQLAAQTRQVIQENIALLDKQIQESQAHVGQAMRIDPAGAEWLRAHFAQLMLLLLAFFWALAMWLAGRLARFWTGTLRRPESLIKLFRIRQRYIFLLIAALVLEILSVLFQWEALRIVARPLLVWCGLAFFVEGVGVLLFVVAVRRAMGQPASAFWLNLTGLVLLVLYPPGGLMLGLIDVWVDFRKIDPRASAGTKPDST